MCLITFWRPGISQISKSQKKTSLFSIKKSSFLFRFECVGGPILKCLPKRNGSVWISISFVFCEPPIWCPNARDSLLMGQLSTTMGPPHGRHEATRVVPAGCCGPYIWGPQWQPVASQIKRERAIYISEWGVSPYGIFCPCVRWEMGLAGAEKLSARRRRRRRQFAKC